jgi:DNA-dependent protein kinase catalytic subunit
LHDIVSNRLILLDLVEKHFNQDEKNLYAERIHAVKFSTLQKATKVSILLRNQELASNFCSHLATLDSDSPHLRILQLEVDLLEDFKIDFEAISSLEKNLSGRPFELLELYMLLEKANSNSTLSDSSLYFKKSIKLIESLHPDEKSPDVISKVYLYYGKMFYELLLKNSISESKMTSDKLTEFSISATRNFLLAMYFGSENAIQQFPCVMEVMSNFSEEAGKYFEELVNRIPIWKFIRWSPQLLANMRSTKHHYYGKILLNIAKEYPQAIYYSFSMAIEDLRHSIELKSFIAEMKNFMNLEQLDKFVNSLEALDFPLQKYKDWKNSTMLAISDANFDLAVELYQEFMNQCFSHTEAVYVPFLKYRSPLEKTFGKSGEKLKDLCNSRDTNSFVNSLSKIKIDESTPLPFGNYKLENFSSFLHSYKGFSNLQSIEIPGQYHGYSKPIPEDHVKITGFDPMLLIMKSLRRPKRISIRGNDEKDYKWLVKSGEDLRLDQRVEQMFQTINQILIEDAACFQRELNLKTYQVVPMTPRVGMIQWVDGTTPLKAIITQNLDDYSKMHSSSKRKHDIYA